MITIELLAELGACYVEPRDPEADRDTHHPDYNETKDMHERILEWIGEGKTLRQIVANKEIPRVDVMWVFDKVVRRDWPLWSQVAKDNPYNRFGWTPACEAYFSGVFSTLGDKADQ